MTMTLDYICSNIYHDSFTVTDVFSQAYYNHFREKMITTMKIFIITVLQNDRDKFRKFAVTWQKNLVVRTKLQQ